jgi:hypothetical protein
MDMNTGTAYAVVVLWATNIMPLSLILWASNKYYFLTRKFPNFAAKLTWVTDLFFKKIMKINTNLWMLLVMYLFTFTIFWIRRNVMRLSSGDHSLAFIWSKFFTRGSSCMLSIIFGTESGENIFFRKLGEFLADYTTSRPTTQYSS